MTIDPGYLEKYKNASWMETYTGRKFWPANPRAQDITIFDIAHALSLKCRYNGHSKSFYSVAEHSVILAMYARIRGLPVATQLELLMHDGAEAYLPDVPRPIKHFFPDLIQMEHRLDDMIREFSGLTGMVPLEVKDFDSRIIRDEWPQVMSKTANDWMTDTLDPLGVVVNGFLPVEAEMRFLQAWQTLMYEHTGKHALLTWPAGGFRATLDGNPIKTDSGGLQIGPDVRMIDLLGKCALVAIDTDAGQSLQFVDGDWQLFVPK